MEPIIPRADEDVCHVYDYAGSLSLCGMKGAPNEKLHRGEFVNGVCTGCGKRACKTCEVMEFYFWENG